MHDSLHKPEKLKDGLLGSDDKLLKTLSTV